MSEREPKNRREFLLRLGTDAAIGGTTAARDRSSSTVKEREPDVIPGAHLGNFLLRLIQRPVRRQIAAVLVAVRIADHDDLLVTH